jgi:predicted dehydrogenase
MGYPHRVTRRTFLSTIGGGALAAAAAGAWISPARAGTGANDQVVLALIGCGGMGNRHLDSLVKRTDSQVAAVCDVYIPRAQAARDKVGGSCEWYQDYRRILDRDDIDAVFCPTPDHWHALMTIHACQAWKDVYVEKPLSTTITEGRAMVEAARRYGRVVQVGTQQRSLKLFQDAVGIVQSGRLGQVTAAGTWIGPNGQTGPETYEPVPEGLDWDLWLGPAPYVPFSPQRFGSFRAFHDYANGELTNWGVHLMDIVLWAIRENWPLSISAAGGSYRTVPGSDDHENLEILYKFRRCNVTWQQRHSYQIGGKGYGIHFHGTAGRLFMDRESFVVEPEGLAIPETFETGDPWIDVDSHHRNFIECIKTRQRPNSDVELGHFATALVLLGAIALDCNRTLEWDGDRERFIGDPAADRHLSRPYRAPWSLTGGGMGR